MFKSIRIIALMLVVFVALQALSQTNPCPAGTMANVIGTSCSVGPMIFNFQTDFLGTGSAQISPVDVGFIPIQSGNQAGFRLVVNFVDVASPEASLVYHSIQFSYLPQAAPGNEIRVQSLSMDAVVEAAAPQSTAAAKAADFQHYVNSGFLYTDVGVGTADGTEVFNVPIDNEILETPGFFSDGSGYEGYATTTVSSGAMVSSFAMGTASATLTSATFLYTTGPIIPDPSLAPLNYTNIDLPTAAATIVNGINNAGSMVGTFRDSNRKFHGYVANPDGSLTTIDVPGATRTFAEGLNEKGDVVGAFTDADRHTHGFVLHDGAITPFDVPGSAFTEAIGINNRGQVVGGYKSADEGFHAFLLDDGRFTTIDHGPGTGVLALTDAFTINNQSEIGGTFFDPSTFRSFLQKNGSVNIVDVPGQGDTIIGGINDRGDAVGTYLDTNFTVHGFVLIGDAFRTVDFPGGTDTSPSGINDTGKIVGFYIGTDGDFHSFLAVPTADDGQDHRPNSNSDNQAQARPSCSDEIWQAVHVRLRNTATCKTKH